MSERGGQENISQIHNSTASFLCTFLNQEFLPVQNEELDYAPLPLAGQWEIEIFTETRRGQIAEKVNVIGINHKSGKLVVEKDGGNYYLAPEEGVRWQIQSVTEMIDRPKPFSFVTRIFKKR